MVTLEPQQASIGRVLMSTGVGVYERIRNGEGFPTYHASGWENWQQSQTFLNLGYTVDVIDFTNKRFVPNRRYDIVLDVLSNLGRFAPGLKDDCIKIFHPHWQHWLKHNSVIYRRTHEILQTTGVALRPRPLLNPNDSVERCDVITQMGNAVASGTYDFAGKPSFPVRHSSNLLTEWSPRDFAKARLRFLWLGGKGLVCKGLDLVLRAFARMPDLELKICGRISMEPDFEAVYAKLLYDTPNIETLGLVDVMSQEFSELAQSCVAIVNPSVSELCCGSVLDGIQLGLIPIASADTGVNLGEFGVRLDNTEESVIEAVRFVADSSESLLEDRSRQAWKYARAHHTREAYRDDFKVAIDKILSREWS